MRNFASALRAPATLRTESEWCDLAGYAGTHGLAGLLWDSGAAEHAPDGVRDNLQITAQQVGERNLHMMDELGRVADAFERARVPLMPLKGAALLLTAYPTGSSRPMSDLDLLVHPHNAIRALDVLRSQGYRDGAALVRHDFFPRRYYETEMLLPGRRPVRVDLHAHPWRPLPLAQIVRHEEFWENSVETSLGGTQLRLPSPETFFVHLAAHAAFHGGARLIWLLDLQRVVDHYGNAMDWTRVAHHAQKWQLSLAIQWAVTAAEQVLGSFVPDEVRAALRKAPPTWRDRLMLWSAPRAGDSPVLNVACNTLGLQGLKPRLEYLRATLSPDTRHLGEVYPFRHPGWPVCAHLWRVLRNLGRAVTLGLMPFRRMIRGAGVYA